MITTLKKNSKKNQKIKFQKRTMSKKSVQKKFKKIMKMPN